MTHESIAVTRSAANDAAFHARSSCFPTLAAAFHAGTSSSAKGTACPALSEPPNPGRAGGFGSDGFFCRKIVPQVGGSSRGRRMCCSNLVPRSSAEDIQIFGHQNFSFDRMELPVGVPECFVEMQMYWRGRPRSNEGLWHDSVNRQLPAGESS